MVNLTTSDTKIKNSHMIYLQILYIKLLKNFVVLPLPDILEFHLAAWMWTRTFPVLTELDSFISSLLNVTLLHQYLYVLIRVLLRFYFGLSYTDIDLQAH